MVLRLLALMVVVLIGASCSRKSTRGPVAGDAGGDVGGDDVGTGAGDGALAGARDAAVASLDAAIEADALAASGDAASMLDVASSEAPAPSDAAGLADVAAADTARDGGAAGEIAFSAPRLIPAPLEAERVTIGDLDGDGRNEVVVGTFSSMALQLGALWLYRQDAGGSLGDPVRFAFGREAGDGPGELTIATARAGQPAVLFAGMRGAVGVFPQTSPLVLGQPALLDPGGGASNSNTPSGWEYALGDFDHDGRLDVVTAERDGRNLVFFLQAEAGLPATPSLRVPTSNAGALYAADFDGDGRDDVLATGWNRFAVFLQRAEGGFSTARIFEAFRMSGVVVGDVLGDGKAEIVAQTVSDWNAPARMIVLAVTNLGFIEVAQKPGAQSNSWTVADLDGDGRKDIVGLSDSARLLEIYRGNAQGLGDREAPAFLDNAPHTGDYRFAIGDLNGDGRADVAVAMSTGLLVRYRQ